MMKVHCIDNNSTLKRVVNGVNVARSWVAMIPQRDTLKKVTRRDIPLSGKKNYFWSIDYWNSSFQLKAIYNWSFEIAQGNGILGLGWRMWTTLLKTTQGMILLARALKNLSISIFIKVLPTSVSRILATHLTTMMNSGGRCRCKGR